MKNTADSTRSSIAELSVNTIRTLCLDSVENAKNGHLGMPLGSAPMAYVLWKNKMKHNPKNPDWFNRDRFVLTSGHGSILLYTLLHLSGYDMTIEDLKGFRKLNSRTPGHPEVHVTPGVEATTGPLGQGLALTVGMALAEAHLAAKFNREDFNVIDHYTFTICGDGDLMEGVAQEAASLAGQLGLGRLIVLYDSNDVTSDGPVDISNVEDVQGKFQAMGWQVLQVQNGNDLESISDAIDEAKSCHDKPTLIEVKNVIGFGSPNLQGTAKIHSNPVGEQESKLIKQAYGWEYKEPFYIPKEVKESFLEIEEKGKQEEEKWNLLFKNYKKLYPELAAELEKTINDGFTLGEETLRKFNTKKMATRSASGEVLNRLYNDFPTLVGGSADLASSNKTTINNQRFMKKGDYSGPNIHFGVREFAMASITSGLTLHGGVKGYCGTFLVFSDYMRSAIRHSALMEIPVTYVFTHDSFLLGPDGPTHQPIEHLISLRAMPNLTVIRPADAIETIGAWKVAIESKKTPVVIALGRHDVPVLENASLEGVQKGAYMISPAIGEAEGIIIATGSEVELALKAQAILHEDGIEINVVSMPSWELFEKQDSEYKEEVLPKRLTKRLSVEMGSKYGWEQYVGSDGMVMSVDKYGASGHANDLVEWIHFTVNDVVENMKKLLNILD
ncbi:transketolase [Neobacillus mesonae]|uniref:transketolase n=1 Tax=Neobacillus mesonae TaxID=1193713 RepID=UPI00203ADA80|nr:transketolase [Neobacillus mesonae]MCM3569367.1 transketolase [Neobacillus mesonae]